MAFLYVLDAKAGPVRDGHKLVVPHFGKSFAGVPLPSVCVKCGSPATRSVDKAFYWHSPFVYFYLLVLFPVGYLIASRMIRKGIELSVPFCPAHSTRRRNFLLTAGLLPVASLILLRFIGLNNNETVAGIKAALFFLICLACVIVAAIFWNPMRPKRIDDVCGVFTGCSEEFLRDLPVYKLPTSSGSGASDPATLITRSSGEVGSAATTSDAIGCESAFLQFGFSRCGVHAAINAAHK